MTTTTDELSRVVAELVELDARLNKHDINSDEWAYARRDFSGALVNHFPTLLAAARRVGELEESLFRQAESIAALQTLRNDLRTQLSAAVAERDAVQAVHHRDLDLSNKCIDALTRERDAAREALREIIKCECLFKVDPLEHAREAVEHCRELARAALGEGV